MTRDVAPRLGLKKPAVIHSKFFPSLQGPKTKMSASTSNSAIFMTDTAEEIAKKVRKYAFSGGRTTLEEHKQFGGNVDTDVPFQYLSVFEFNDLKLENIKEAFSLGKMTSNEIKELLVEVLVPFITSHQKARAQVTDEIVNEFMSVRPLEFENLHK